MYIDGKQQVEGKVEQLNQKLIELGIPQVRFEFEPKISLIRLTYQKKPTFDVIDYEISDDLLNKDNETIIETVYNDLVRE